MKWSDLVEALLIQPPERPVVVRFFEVDRDGRVVDWQGSIPILRVEPDGHGNTVIYLVPHTPRPPQWTKIPPECPPPLSKLICEMTLVSPGTLRKLWQHIYDHYSSFDDVPL